MEVYDIRGMGMGYIWCCLYTNLIIILLFPTDNNIMIHCNVLPLHGEGLKSNNFTNSRQSIVIGDGSQNGCVMPNSNCHLWRWERYPLSMKMLLNYSLVILYLPVDWHYYYSCDEQETLVKQTFKYTVSSPFVFVNFLFSTL